MYIPKSFVPEQSVQTKSTYVPKSFTPTTRDWGKNFGGNVLKSGGRLIGDTVGAIANIFNPNMEKNTVANLGKLALGTGSLLLPGEQKYEPMAKAVGKFYKDRYGGVENIKNTLYNDPVGMLADAATVATGVGGALRGGGAVASKLGSVSNASKLSQAGRTMTNIGRQIDPLILAGKGVRVVGNKAIRGVDSFGRNYASAGLGNPAATGEANRILKNIDFKRVDPVTGKKVSSKMVLGDLIDEGDLYSRSVDDLTRYSDDLSKTFDKIADNPRLAVKLDDVLAPIDKLIKETKVGIKDFPGEVAFKTQLKELTKQRANIISKAKNGVISGNVVLRMKRGLGSITSPDAIRGVDLKQGSQMAKSKSISGLRSGLRKASPKLTKLGKRMQAIGFESKPGAVMKAFIGNQSRASVRNPITLSRSVGLGLGAGIGAGVGGMPGAIAGSIVFPAMNEFLNSPTGVKLLSKGSRAAASGLGKSSRFVTPKASLFQRYVGGPARMLNNPFNADQTNEKELLLQSPQSQRQQLQVENPYSEYTPKSDLLDEIAKKQGLNVEEMRKKRLNFKRN